MREWKATLTSEKSFSGWIFNSGQPPKGTLSAHSCIRAAQRFSTLAPPRNLYSPRRLRRTTRRRDFVPWRFPAARRQSAYVAPLAEKLHKAQTQRFRAVSSASALYPEHPSVSRPSGRAGPAPRC
jgi:hypothetical protein